MRRELVWHGNKRLERLRKQAKLKCAGACVEDLDRRGEYANPGVDLIEPIG